MKEQNQNPDSQKVPVKELSDKDLFRSFIEGKYTPFGVTSHKVYKTSRDLAYEAREFCEPSLPDIASVLTELEYTSEAFMGNYTWVLYEIDPFRY